MQPLYFTAVQVIYFLFYIVSIGEIEDQPWDLNQTWHVVGTRKWCRFVNAPPPKKFFFGGGEPSLKIWEQKTSLFDHFFRDFCTRHCIGLSPERYERNVSHRQTKKL